MQGNTLDSLNAQLMIKAASTPQILEGENGPGLIFRAITIHHSENPAEEAKQWVLQALSKTNIKTNSSPTLAMVFGLGLGWHLSCLKQMFPNIRVAVFEPDRSLINLFEKYNVLNRNENIDIFTVWSEFEQFISQEVVYSEGAEPVTLTVPGYQKLWTDAAEIFETRIRAEITRRSVIEKTRTATNSIFMDNLIKNVSHCPKVPDVMLLRDRLPGRPAFIVGAGPSLTINGELLGQIGNRGLIICAASALKPLLAMGVTPQVVVVLESSDTSSYLRLNPEEKKVLGENTVLAMAAGCHPAHFELEGYYKSLFHLNGGEAQLLSQGLFLPQGGNAGTAAFALAWAWGLAPLILVGQDQAYLGRHLHADGTADSVIEENRGQTIMLPGIGNTTVESHTGLLASINWLEEAAATIYRKPFPPKLINASAQGASIRGFEEISLEILLTALTPVDNQINLPTLLSDLPLPTVKELRGDLKQFSGLLTSLRQLTNSNLQRALVEMMNISRVSAFMGQLLAPALASGHKVAMLRNLEWAETVILKMLTSLSTK